MTTVGINRDGLHVLLWHRAKGGTITVNQQALAKELYASKFSISRVLKTMVDEGRLERVEGARGCQPRTYKVIDPSAWRQSDRTPCDESPKESSD